MNLQNQIKLFALLSLLASQLSGAILFLQFSGAGNANGNVDGVAFSDQDWLLELGVDDSVVDSYDNVESGFFEDAFVSASLIIGETTFQLSDSLSGSLSLTATNGDRKTGSFSFNPDWGGYLSFSAALSSVQPAVFGDANLLSSLVVGSSIDNSVSDGSSNGSIANFSVYEDMFDMGDGSPGLLGANDEKIEFHVNAANGSGEMTVSVSNVSAVPEVASFAFILSLMTLSGGMVLRRRRSVCDCAL